jgi:tetratricopeptide (TPR) repeat protein
MEKAPLPGRAAIRLRPSIIAAAALMLLWLTGYWFVSQLHWDLIQISRQGPRALALYFAGNYRDAARAYREGQRGAPPVTYANDPAGYWALRAGDPTEAERRARTTLALVPSALEPRVTLGELALDRGRTADAVAAFDAVLTRWPAHADALYLRALAVARTDPARAIVDLNRGLRSSSVGDRDTILYRTMELAGELRARPAEAQPLCLLAHLHRYLRVFDDRQGTIAIDYARRAIAANDRPADAHLTIGIVLEKRGDHQAAQRAFRQAIAADPSHAHALWRLASHARSAGDTLLEYRMMTRAFEAAPTDPFYLPHLELVVSTRLDDPRGMAALMQRAVAADPANAEAHARLGLALERLGDKAGARRSTQRGFELLARQVDGR